MNAFMKSCTLKRIIVLTYLHVAVSSSPLSSCPTNGDITNVDSSCINRASSSPPHVSPLILMNNVIYTIPISDSETTTDHAMNREYMNDPPPTKPVYGCCSKIPIGYMPQMTSEQSKEVLDNAVSGWNHGQGLWSQMTIGERIEHVNQFCEELMKLREDIAKTLMWEIGKSQKDAYSEVDRTIKFIQQTIETIQTHPDFNPSAMTSAVSSSKIFIRRNGVGIVLCLGPYNYPLNETYAALIPALLMGNIAILKIPTIGGLSHLLTFRAFQRSFPANTVNFISGSGRQTLPPLMESGKINQLSFIGGTKAADLLIKQHPSPHRLKVFLQLEAKNMGILLEDLFEQPTDSDATGDRQGYPLSEAFDEIIRGALSYNGQRCTALKIIFVPKGFGPHVAEELSKRVNTMNIGMPWYEPSVQITPLPNHQRVEYMKELIGDALSKGAKICNENGGTIIKGDKTNDDKNVVDSSTLFRPAVLYPVTKEMTIYREEQFGPIIPVVEYDDTEEMIEYATQTSPYGQQVSIFSSGIGDPFFNGENSKNLAYLIDSFSTTYGKINLNSQCARSPDSVPFTARKSSGLGIMSIMDALKEFSVPTVVSYKETSNNGGYMTTMMKEVKKESKFMSNI